MSANVGFIPDGYSAFGYLGILIMSLLMKGVMNIFDQVYIKSKGDIIVLVFVLSFSYVFTNSALLTVFLTHGLLLLIVIFSIFPWTEGLTRKNNYEKLSNRRITSVGW